MPTYRHGRHEYGQNFLRDHRVIRRIVDLAGAGGPAHLPIIEIGPGDGAVTLPLQRLGRPLTVVEADPRTTARLTRTLDSRTVVHRADFLTYRLPRTPHVVVGNLPFHLTTRILRRLLHGPGWERAVLLVQWEVARRRAGVGGSSMMTAQWAPWFDFGLDGRVPASAFVPRPSVDGGLLVIDRRREPLLPERDRRRYQTCVHGAFTARGNTAAAALVGCRMTRTVRQARTLLSSHGLPRDAKAKDLPVSAWVDLFRRAAG